MKIRLFQNDNHFSYNHRIIKFSHLHKHRIKNSNKTSGKSQTLWCHWWTCSGWHVSRSKGQTTKIKCPRWRKRVVQCSVSGTLIGKNNAHTQCQTSDWIFLPNGQYNGKKIQRVAHLYRHCVISVQRVETRRSELTEWVSVHAVHVAVHTPYLARANARLDWTGLDSPSIHLVPDKETNECCLQDCELSAAGQPASMTSSIHWVRDICDQRRVTAPPAQLELNHSWRTDGRTDEANKRRRRRLRTCLALIYRLSASPVHAAQFIAVRPSVHRTVCERGQRPTTRHSSQ